MRIGSGRTEYEWIDDWAKIPDTESARTGWAHHGVVVSETGDIIAFHQADRTFLAFDSDGNLKRSWPSGLTEAHGITLVKEGETEYIWVADNGRKQEASLNYGYPSSSGPLMGRVVKMTLDGNTVLALERPELSVYDSGNYFPTGAVVNEEQNGGNGDLWVSDGYGEWYIHHYDKTGNYLGSINGEEGKAGRFGLPHGVCIDTRKDEPELYITDQRNHRIQVYDMDGQFKRAFGTDILRLPGEFLILGELMFVLDLRGRITVLDADDKLVTHLGDYDDVWELEGWPNIPSTLVEAGKFIGPHGIAADRDGNLYVAEWLIGGRMTKLAKT